MTEESISTELREYLLPALHEVVNSLPLGSARLDESCEGMLKIIPQKADAAEIWVNVDGPGMGYFGFGKEHPGLEMFQERKFWEEDRGLLRDCCMAIVQGHCEFRKGFLSHAFTVILDGRRRTGSYFFHAALIPKTKKYASYIG